MPPNGKYAEGLRGFPTPNDVPADGGYIVFRIPKDNEWAGLILGAAQALTEHWNFYQWGDMLPEEAAEAFRQIVNQAPYEACGCEQPGGRRVLRVNANGHIEQLTDGEWTEPTDDYTIPPVPPRTEPTCEERRCLAAANCANVLQQLYEEVADAVADGADEAEALAVMIGFAVITIGGWLGLALAALVGLALGLFTAFLEICEFMTADLWTSDFTDKLQCILYECSSCDGDVVTFDFQCVRERMAEYTDLLDPQVITNIRLFGQVDFMLNVIGVDGLNAAGATTAIETADCTDCQDGWCRLYDFTIDEQGWEAQDGFQAVYTSGVGWQTIGLDTAPSFYRYAAIVGFIAADIEYIEMGFSLTQGDCYDTGDKNLIASQGFANIFWQNDICSDPTSPAVWCFNDLPEPAPVTTTQILVQMFAGASALHVDPGGQVTITYVKLMGRGTPPTGGQICDYETCE